MRLQETAVTAKRQCRISLTKAVIFGAVMVGVFFFLMGLKVEAAPFLVCDQPDGADVEWYEVVGTPAPNSTQYLVPMHIDLENIPPGSYTVRARACHFWDCSSWTDALDFTRPESISRPGTPALVRE